MRSAQPPAPSSKALSGVATGGEIAEPEMTDLYAGVACSCWTQNASSRLLVNNPMGRRSRLSHKDG